MPLEEPGWWYGAESAGVLPRLLRPFEALYARAVERRFRTSTPYRARVPVICIGNFTAGGTGKTPLSRFLLAKLAADGISAACLTRGYGGRLEGPVWVDPEHHTAREAGDEPLLIASDARVMLARHRPAGLKAIEAGQDIAAVIMDDGLQNPTVAKDLTIAIVDAVRGFGNGRVIPAGPLRASLEFQLGLVDCIVVMGEDPPPGTPAVFEHLKQRFPGPVLRARIVPSGDASWIAGANVRAYAGIANPGRFFRLAESLGPRSLTRLTFADHHAFTEAEAESLLREARTTGATLLTTEKDLARLSGASGSLADLRAQSRTLPIAVTFDEHDLLRLYALIDGALKAGSRAV